MTYIIITRTMNLIVLFIYLFHYIHVGFSFNLEPRIPVLKIGKAETYFGFSVAEHIILNKKTYRTGSPESKILVGAPRAQSGQPGANHSGAIFACPFTSLTDDCDKLNVEDISSEVEKDELKDDQWLGVTVKSQGPGGYVMACAHRYVKQGANYRWGNGICYSLTQDLDFDYMFDPCYNRAVEKAHEQYGYCQAGTSGVIAEDNSIVIGTPGPYTWRGTVFINSITQDMKDDITWYFGPVSPVEKYSYLGMAVTSGKFFKNKISYVAGAPRANNVGQVVFFTKEKGNNTLSVQLILSGELFASSFGYEVASADLNKDGRPDLIVGAPFFYGKDIGGAIYIYMNSNEGITHDTVPTKIKGKADSRFGFAISNCSDLNKDGYEDIAVGAPYEGKGVVYIYMGSSSGINTVPSQIIRSEDLPYHHIVSFGHSLSGGLDLDQNGYPDLIVGAYESDTVILLRARPVIDIITEVDTGDVTISPSTKGCEKDVLSALSCFSIKTCFKITSREVLKKQVFHINYTIEAETFQGRMISRVNFKRASNSAKKHIVNRTFEVGTRSYSHCEEDDVYLRENIQDIQTPVQFKLTYSLIQDEPSLPRRRIAVLPDINNYPILNQQEASKVFQVNFEKDCGDDDICESDLQVKAVSYPDGILDMGTVNNVTLEITVFNKRESAYGAAVYIVHPESLGFIQGIAVFEKIQYHCHPFNKTLLVCSLENPFKKLPEPTVVTVYFNPSKVRTVETQLRFTIFANSTSKEVTDKPNIHLVLNVIRRAKLTYNGKSSPEQVHYGGEIRGASDMKHEADIGSNVVHYHKFWNDGPAYIDSMTLTFHWPYEIENNRERGKYLLYLTHPPTFRNAYGECNIDSQYINELRLKLDKTDEKSTSGIEDGDFHEAATIFTSPKENETSEHAQEESHTRTKTRTETRSETRSETRTETRTETRQTSSRRTSSEERESSRQKRETSSAQTASENVQRNTVIFECNKTAKCLTFQCTVFKIWAKSGVEIIFKSRLWNSTLVMDYPEVPSVQIKTAVDIGVDAISKLELIEPIEPRQYIITTAFPDIPFSQLPQEIPFWVYILAACIGIILLVLLILCLWKVGFFKRKKPDEMMKGNLEKRNDMNSHDY